MATDQQALALEVDNISIAYNNKRVIEALSLSVQRNEIVCLLGESGSGKTSVLKSIAGLLPLEQGEIRLGQRILSSQHGHVLPEQRKISMIFQDFALFPHLSVIENVCFGIKASKQQAHQQGLELLDLVKMTRFENRFPNELSGGQQQRVAIARALAAQPDILLLDEPFTNVDHHLREQLMLEMRQILKQQGTAAVFVTHSRQEAFTFADTLAFMQAGKIVQQGDAEALYFQPATPLLAESLGEGNWLSVEVIDPSATRSDKLGVIPSLSTSSFTQGQQLRQFIRPHQLFLQADDNGLGTIVNKIFNGDSRYYLVDIGDQQILKIGCNSIENRPIGSKVAIEIKPHQAILFENEA